MGNERLLCSFQGMKPAVAAVMMATGGSCLLPSMKHCTLGLQLWTLAVCKVQRGHMQGRKHLSKPFDYSCPSGIDWREFAMHTTALAKAAGSNEEDDASYKYYLYIRQVQLKHSHREWKQHALCILWKALTMIGCCTCMTFPVRCQLCASAILLYLCVACCSFITSRSLRPLLHCRCWLHVQRQLRATCHKCMGC